jgi:type II secretory pathway component PulF
MWAVDEFYHETICLVNFVLHIRFGLLLASVGDAGNETAGWILPYIGAKLLLAVLFLCIGLAICAALLFLVHFLLTLPIRRAERARLFLDLLDPTIQQGRPLEETLISASQSRDESLGVHFHWLAAWLEENLRFSDALAKVPRFLPPQVNAMLMAGQKIGDLRKVLPACRQLLKDAVSQTRSAINYLVILTFVITPMGAFVFGALEVLVIPKFKEILAMEGDATGMLFLEHFAPAFLRLQFGLLLLLWLAVFLYAGGPRVAGWFPVLDRLYFHLPWRRKRMQRDFSTLLALLLDSGVPEPEAVALAADGTANAVFRSRAAQAVERMRQGVKLTQAVQSLDDSGEFAWRLSNAVHGQTGFLQALAGWHESLDAKAFQQEQAAAHGVTSALVLWNGLFVATVVISVFMCLTSLTNLAVLW